MTKYLLCFHGKSESHVRTLFLCIYILLLTLSLSSQYAVAEIYGSYVGAQTCDACHNEIVDGWRQTRHAEAFTSLVKSKQQDLPDCLRCHVVGYGHSGGFLDAELTIELAGIQCESCHGPGKRHSDEPEMENILGDPSERVCRTCHTKGQDPNFDYQKKRNFVHKGMETYLPEQRIGKEASTVDAAILIENEINELAPVEEGTRVVAYVTIKNGGKEEIQITDVISS